LRGDSACWGAETFFLTGTNEHGKIERAAQAAGKTEQYADEISRSSQTVEADGISNDDFIRTTEERHRSVCRNSSGRSAQRILLQGSTRVSIALRELFMSTARNRRSCRLGRINRDVA